MKKKILAFLMAAALTTGILAGCGASGGGEASTQAGSDNKITIAASATPHAEILEAAKPLLKEKGYDLEVTVFDDYIMPNNVVEEGEMDANYFQHIPYLDDFNKNNGTHLVNAGAIHYEPLGIYPGKKKDLGEIADGDTIMVPNDPTNEARALLLLQTNGLLTLKADAGLSATVADVETTKADFEIKELEAEQIARKIEEVEYGVINGNYALAAGFSVKTDSLAYETVDSEAAQTYMNVIAVKEGNENSDKIKALVEVLGSDEITKFINDTYGGAVVPAE